MQAVNLLPLEARPASRWTAIGTGLTPNRVIPIGGAVAAAIALLLAGLYVYERSVVNDKQNTLADRAGAPRRGPGSGAADQGCADTGGRR